MNKEKLIKLLERDLQNEYMHMIFYLHHASTVVGLHRHEIGELLFESAQSEMNHVLEFSKLLVGLNVYSSFKNILYFPHLSNPKDILAYAHEMETEVVANYVERKKQAEELGGVDGTYIALFLEDQIVHSREDADELKEMIKGV